MCTKLLCGKPKSVTSDMVCSMPPPVRDSRGNEHISPQASAGERRSAVLGRMPWDSRATALGPDIRRNGRDPRRFNGGFKKIGRAGRGSVGEDGALGL